MQEIEEKIVAALQADTTLRNLLEATEAPWKIYYESPPKHPDFPLVTYFFNTGAINSVYHRPLVPKEETYNFTAWGDNYEAVLDRILELLHDKKSIFQGTTTVQVEMIKLDFEFKPVFDEDFEVWSKQVRYRMKLRRI